MNTVWFYCPKCATRKRPQLDDLFVTVGKKDNFIVHIVQFHDKHNDGFCPHTVKMTKSENGFVYFTYRCGMDGCGYIVELDEPNRKAMAWEIKGAETKSSIPIAQWNAMIMYRDPDFELD